MWAYTVAVPQSHRNRVLVAWKLQACNAFGWQQPVDSTFAGGSSPIYRRLGNPKTQRRPHRMDPTPHLDSGQSRVNDYQHPPNYLQPDEDEPNAD
jgi:hypothetical protein